MIVFLRNVITPVVQKSGLVAEQNCATDLGYCVCFDAAILSEIFDTSSFHPATISFERFESSEEKEPLQT